MSIKSFLSKVNVWAGKPAPVPHPTGQVGAGVPSGAAAPLDQARSRVSYTLVGDQTETARRPAPSSAGGPAPFEVQNEPRIADASALANSVAAGAVKPPHPYGE